MMTTMPSHGMHLHKASCGKIASTEQIEGRDRKRTRGKKTHQTQCNLNITSHNFEEIEIDKENEKGRRRARMEGGKETASKS